MRNTSKYWVQPDKVVLLKTRIVEHLPHLASGPGGHQLAVLDRLVANCADVTEQLIRQLNKVKDSEGWWRAVRKQQSSKIYQHLSKFQMWLYWVLFLETRERPLTRCKTSRPPRYLIFGASQSVACQHESAWCWEMLGDFLEAFKTSRFMGRFIRFIVLHPQPIAICTECCPNFKSWVANRNLCVSNRKWCGLLGKPTSHICTIYTCSSLCCLTCFMCPNCVPRSKKNCWNLGTFCPFLPSSSVIWGRSGPWLACHAMFRVAKEPFALLDLEYRDGMDSHVT